MAYQVTFVNTKNNSDDPEFPDWVGTLSDDYLNPLYPELNGATPTDVLDAVPNAMDPANGFISATNTISDDGAVHTLVELWDSQESYETFKNIIDPLLDANCNVGTISCSITSTTVTGTGTNFTHLVYNDMLLTSDGTVIGNIASITSDSSLTLQSNASRDLTNNSGWEVGHKPNALTYLHNQYPDTGTTEVTTANV